MPILPAVHQVFGHFQNLNLLALLNDLGNGESVRQAWFSSGRLCPVAHGLPAGQQVRELTIWARPPTSAKVAITPPSILAPILTLCCASFRSWDEGVVRHEWLLRQLQAFGKSA